MSPLIRRIDAQQTQIKQQSEELKQKQLEFETVTSSMKEGIVLLSGKGRILSINRAAQRLFGADESCAGEDVLSVNCNLELAELVRRSEMRQCDKI